MRLISKGLKNKLEYKKLALDSTDDLYALTNVIQRGDLVEAKTLRAVPQTTGAFDDEQIQGNAGKKKVLRKLIYITVRAQKIVFDGEEIRITGVITDAGHHESLKTKYHTLALTPGDEVTVIKEFWDFFALQTLDQYVGADTMSALAMVFNSTGKFTIYELRHSVTRVLVQGYKAIPRKYDGQGSVGKTRGKQYNDFFNVAKETLLRTIENRCKADWTIPVLLISMPYMNKLFSEYFKAWAVDNKVKTAIQLQQGFITLETSSEGKTAIREALKSISYKSALNKLAIAADGNEMDQFQGMFHTDPDRVWYGEKHVDYALEMSAVSVLFLSSNFVRGFDHAKRSRYAEATQAVQQNGGKVFMYSHLQDSGRQIDALGGIAAILRFPLNDDAVELEDAELSDYSDDE